MKKIALLVLVSVAMLACGGGAGEAKKEMKSSDTKAAPVKEMKEEAPEASSDDGNVVVLESTDGMKFNKTEIKVKAGGTVTLTLKHTGSMAKQVMGHNFVLLKAGTDLGQFAVSAMGAIDSDYIPEGTTDVLAKTKLLGGGESDTITFDTPEKGTYSFLCTFPGHFANMQGTFIVE